MHSGQIIKALSGFYYVEEDGVIYQCKASGKFRKNDQKPLVGDFCEFSIENETEGYIRHSRQGSGGKVHRSGRAV